MQGDLSLILDFARSHYQAFLAHGVLLYGSPEEAEPRVRDALVDIFGSRKLPADDERVAAVRERILSDFLTGRRRGARLRRPERSDPDALTRRQHACLVLSTVEHMSTAAIAQVIRCSEDAVQADLAVAQARGDVPGVNGASGGVGDAAESEADLAVEAVFLDTPGSGSDEASRFAPGGSSRHLAAAEPSRRSGAEDPAVGDDVGVDVDADEAARDVAHRAGRRRRRRPVFAAAITVAVLALVGTGVITTLRLLDRPEVVVAVPDRIGTNGSPTGFDTTDLCQQAPASGLLRESTGPLRLTTDFDTPFSPGLVGLYSESPSAASSVLESLPSVVVENQSSAGEFALRDGSGFILVRNNKLVMVPTFDTRASSGFQYQSRVLAPGETLHLEPASGWCISMFGAGVVTAYPVVFATAATDSSGALPPLSSAFMVVGTPFTVTTVRGPNGTDYVSTVSEYDPEAPPAPDFPVLDHLGWEDAYTATPHPLSLVWLTISRYDEDDIDYEFLSQAAITELEDLGYGTTTQTRLSCQPAAFDALGLPPGDDPNDYRGVAVFFESRADADTFASHFAPTHGEVLAVVEADVVC